MTELIKKFSTELLPDGGTVIAAVSGGADSMLLLYLLNEIINSGIKDIALIAAHFNHGIRENAVRDETLVKDYCLKNAIPFRTGRGNVPEYADRMKLSTETAARELRYGFLSSLSQDEKSKNGKKTVIATAHHMDDNAETILLNLIRGCGMSGLIGIKPSSIMRIGGCQTEIIRPMLLFSKADIVKAAEERGIPFVHDETNDIADASRNRLRLEIIPLLRGINPSLSETLIRNASVLAEDEAFFSSYIDREYGSYVRKTDGIITADKARIAAAPLAVKRRIAKHILNLSGIEKDYSFSDIERTVSLFDGTAGRSEKVGSILIQANACTVDFLSGDVLKLASLEEGQLLFSSGRDDFAKLGAVKTPTGELEVSLLDGSEAERVKRKLLSGARIEKEKGYLDFSKLGDEIIVRTKRDGDSFFPVGAPGRKNLGDIMTDIKLPLHRRRTLPIVESGGEIVFVPNIRISETVRVTEGTERILYLLYKDKLSK